MSDIGKQQAAVAAHHNTQQQAAAQQQMQQQVEGQTIQVQQVQIAHDGSDQMHAQGGQVASSGTSTMVMATPQQAMLSQQAMQNLQGQTALAPIQSGGSTTITTMSAGPPQQMTEWPSHGRVQVIQQPIQNPTYIQPVYNAQGQLIVPGNIALHPGNMNQPIQVITAGKAFQPGQVPHMLATAQGKPIVQGQATSFPGYATIPTSGSNQTLVISQLGVLGQTNILSQQQGKPQEMQKMITKTNSSNTNMKPPPGQTQNVSISNLVSSQPQGITTQAQTIIQPQILSPIQYTCNTQQQRTVPQGAPQTMQFAPWQATFGPTGLPQGLTWAPGALQSSALLTQGNQIFIRNPQQEQSGMFIQNAQQSTIPQHNQIASQPINKPTQGIEIGGTVQGKTAMSKTFSAILPNSVTAQNIRPASSVSTQTGQTQASMHQAVAQTVKTGTKVRPKGFCRVPTITMAQKSDPGNQTKTLTTVSSLQPRVVVSNVPSGGVSSLIPDKQPKHVQPQQQVNQQVQGQQQPNLNQIQQMQSMFQEQDQKSQPSQLILSNGLANGDRGIGLSVPPGQMASIMGNMIVHTVPGITSMATNIGLPPGQAEITLSQDIGGTSDQVPVETSLKAEIVEQKESTSQENGSKEARPGRPKSETQSQDPAGEELRSERTEEKSQVVDESTDNDSSEDKENQDGERKTNEKTEAPAPGLPKATVMVKPQVLTHVIEGFVIQESTEPFPVNRGCSDGPVRKMPASEPQESGEPPKKKPLADKDENKERELATCETCGKKDLKSKFKKSKRFCSMSCARRFNVGCSSRVGLFLRADDKLNGSEADGLESHSDSAPSLETEGAAAQSFPNQENENKVNPSQWTVAEVCEFIRTLPGCADYVEDFAMQDIDGEALMLLKPDHLMSVMSMKLGPAVKIIAKIDTMRTDTNASA